MGPMGSPETSALNQPTLRNFTENGIIQVKSNESLCFLLSGMLGHVMVTDVSKDRRAFAFIVQTAETSYASQEA
jgi:hypothetical protein